MTIIVLARLDKVKAGWQMSRDLGKLHPEVERKCRRLTAEVQRLGLHLVVTSTLRRREEQEAIYMQGRRPLVEVNGLRQRAGMAPVSIEENKIVTHARTSVHEFGLAFDVALVSEGAPHWDMKADVDADGVMDYWQLGAIGEGLGLIWGGRFRHRDFCHFEWTGGLTLAELKAGCRPMVPSGTPVKVPSGTPIKVQVGVPDSVQKEKDQSRQSINNKEDAGMDGIKAGIRSSEFYIAMLGALVPVLNTHMGLGIPVEGFLSLAGVVISYIVSRTVVKRA